MKKNQRELEKMPKTEFSHGEKLKKKKKKKKKSFSPDLLSNEYVS